MAKPRVGLLVKSSLRERILSDVDLEKLKSFAEVEINPTDEDFSEEEAAEFLAGKDGAFSSWRVSNLTPSIIERAPELQIWAYGAGSIKGKICDEAWEKGVVVTSAAPAIADDVAAARADGVLAAILLRLDLCHLTGDEDLALSVNDQPLAMTHASWQPSSQYPWNWNGMHGHLEACWDLTHGDYVQQGGNRFTLELRARPDDIAPALFWHALRLEITYNSLPVVSPHFDHG